MTFNQNCVCGGTADNLNADCERCQMAAAIAASNAEIERLREELACLQRLYDLRGKALQRPCLECGRVPLIVKAVEQKGGAQ